MSLVGPRPLFVDQVRSDPQGMTGRHEVPAGITGWWQINGRSDVDYERALQLDLFYIENWSIGLDLYILLKTVGAIVTRRGAV
jgi:lipopolysaccharide/colanic/teichoic acid biosynthesis glycosyltransferase